jgi:hypothetical protein
MFASRLRLVYIKYGVMESKTKMTEETTMDEVNFVDGQARFESVLQVDVPKGRDGKHKSIITRLLGDIAQLGVGSALKIPLSQLPDTKENIRSALNRAARTAKIDLATSSNDEFLYVWKTEKN